MAIKKETLAKIAALLKLQESDLEAKIKSDQEEDIDIPELQTFTADEITARDAAQVSIGKKEGEKEGESKGKELVVKELKKNFGVEFDGKDLGKLTDALKTQFQKGDDAIKQQVTLLQSQLAEKDTLIEQTKKQASEAIFDAQLLGFMPSNRKSVADGGFTDQEYLSAIKANLQFEHTDAGVLVKKGGEVVRDSKTTNPLPAADVVKGYFAERKWAVEADPGNGGRGGGNGKPGNAITKLSELQSRYEAEGKSIVSAEFQREALEMKKANPDFDMGS
jgi:hypothetical protein